MMGLEINNGQWSRINGRLVKVPWHQTAVQIAVMLKQGSLCGASGVGSQLQTRKMTDLLRVKDDVAFALKPLLSLGITVVSVDVTAIEGGLDVAVTYRVTAQEYSTTVFVRVL